MGNPRRVGLLGGTFDPPHVAHLIVAEVARVELGLDQVQLVVAGAPWMKRECSPAEHRVRMVELAVTGDAHLRCNRDEVDRDGPTYTADTLDELTAAEPDVTVFFLLGADAAARLSEWHRIDRAMELAEFVVVTRPGYQPQVEPALRPQVRMLTVPAVDISSTDLRRRFREDRPVRYQLPRAVETYVRTHGLYDAGRQPT